MIFVGSDLSGFNMLSSTALRAGGGPEGGCQLQQGCQTVGAVTFINGTLSTSSNSAPATSLYFDVGGQHRSLPMNGPSSSSYAAPHPPLVSMDGALSNAAMVPDTSRNLEQLIEVFRGRGSHLVSAPGVEDTAAILEKM
jgi:hypothetical protein